MLFSVSNKPFVIHDTILKIYKTLLKVYKMLFKIYNALLKVYNTLFKFFESLFRIFSSLFKTYGLLSNISNSPFNLTSIPSKKNTQHFLLLPTSQNRNPFIFPKEEEDGGVPTVCLA